MRAAIAPTGMATPYPASRPATSAPVTTAACGSPPSSRCPAVAGRRPPMGRWLGYDSSSWAPSWRSTARHATDLHIEAEGAELLAAVVGDLVRTPRRQPDPVDPDVV